MPLHPEAGDALLIVDLQNDFLPGGSLAVPGAESVIAPIVAYLRIFTRALLPIFASRDYHPRNHSSFLPQGGAWPPHCVAESWGADFPPQLQLPDTAIIIAKGTSADREAYSALDSTTLGDLLLEKGVTRVFVCGLATDYCVLASARDLLQAGYHVVLLADAIKAVNITPGDGDRAIASLQELGATLTTLSNLSL